MSVSAAAEASESHAEIRPRPRRNRTGERSKTQVGSVRVCAHPSAPYSIRLRKSDGVMPVSRLNKRLKER